MKSKEDIKNLLKEIKAINGKGQEEVSVAIGYSRKSITEFLSSENNLDNVYTRLELYKATLNKSTPEIELLHKLLAEKESRLRELEEHKRDWKEQNKELLEIIKSGLIDLKASSVAILQKVGDAEQQQLVNAVVMMDSLDRLEKNPEGTLSEVADNAEHQLKEIRKGFHKKQASGK